MLTRVGVPVEFEAEPSAPDHEPTTLICFSHLRWDFVFQRPQHLMSRFAREMSVIYWEEPIEIGPKETAYLKVREAQDAPVSELDRLRIAHGAHRNALVARQPKLGQRRRACAARKEHENADGSRTPHVPHSVTDSRANSPYLDG